MSGPASPSNSSPPAASPPSRLHAEVVERFRIAFGQPTRAEGSDSHWALRKFSYISAVNLLLDTSGEWPVVWVFDPHDPSNGVSHFKIKHESEIDGIVTGIEERVRAAGRPPRH